MVLGVKGTSVFGREMTWTRIAVMGGLLSLVLTAVPLKGPAKIHYMVVSG